MGDSGDKKNLASYILPQNVQCVIDILYICINNVCVSLQEPQSKSKVCANVFCGAGRECAVTEKGEPTCLCIEVRNRKWKNYHITRIQDVFMMANVWYFVWSTEQWSYTIKSIFNKIGKGKKSEMVGRKNDFMIQFQCVTVRSRMRRWDTSAECRIYLTLCYTNDLQRAMWMKETKQTWTNRTNLT